MDDYVSVDVLLSAAEDYDWISGLKTVLKRIPAADVRPVVIGVWKFDDFDGDGLDYQCSVCKQYSRQNYNFCPSCGADMRVGFQVGSDLEPEHNVTELNLTEQSATEQGGR